MSSKDFPSLKNGNTSTNTRSSASSVLKSGAVCLAFLILGFQICLFIQHSVRLKVEASRDRPDTVFVYLHEPSGSPSAASPRSEFAGGLPSSFAAASSPRSESVGGSSSSSPADPSSPRSESVGGRVSAAIRIERRNASHSPSIQKIRSRKVENFPFDPNTVSVEDLQRLGFSQKQALSIEAYRSKGGRFRRKEDFARSYVVSDSVYERLAPYIEIPLLDINRADSAAFDALPGIGPYFAAKMVSYRRALGSYSCKEQLLEIYNFGQERYDKLKDLVCCSPPANPFALWSLPADSLRMHPHIRTFEAARAIVFFRDHNPKDKWTLEALLDAGILAQEQYSGLSRCTLAPVP